MSTYHSNRRLRKAIHILAGFPSLSLKYLSFPYALLLAFFLLIIAILLSPKWKLVIPLLKEEDRVKGYISGVRHYFLTVFILVLLFGYLNSPFLASAGWLALALGDGTAGLVGRRDSAKLPWSRRKTIAGFFSCIVFTFLAILLTYLWFFWGVEFPALFRPSRMLMFALVAFLIAVFESIDFPIDDNYIVGLGTAFLLLLLFQIWPI